MVTFMHHTPTECLEMPHLVHACVALVAALVFALIAFLTIMADFEMDPSSTRWLASPHTLVEASPFSI